MTPERQQIAIAKSCGWRCAATFKADLACWVRPGNADHQTEWIPNYLPSRDAMAEALAGLTEDEWETMADYLLFPNGNGIHSNYMPLGEMEGAL